MNPVDVITTIKHFGVSSIAKGSWHKLSKKLGITKYRFPLTNWKDLYLSSFVVNDFSFDKFRSFAGISFFPVQDVIENQLTLRNINNKSSETIKIADDIAKNKFRYFFNKSVKLDRSHMWCQNPFNGAIWPKKHWSDINFFSKRHGDVKLVWEVNRFSWVYDLIRSYGLTGNSSYSELFWELFEDWIRNNQPNEGVNWISGQECALRIMAWFFAFITFFNEISTTRARIEKMILAIAVHADRIEGFISHAIRQKTNHAMTEATGLYTVGLLFPFLKKAGRYKILGKKVLEEEAIRQIYEDGSYVQQSMNYHRLMLYTYLWAMRLGQLNGDQFSEISIERVTKASEFLYQMQDDISGRVPNYGANDGALIFPLDSCDYLDYRPILQSMSYLLSKKRIYEKGPWDESLLWFFGPDILDSKIDKKQHTSSAFSIGGYYTFRLKNSWGMIRCHSYRDRVGHVDMLHFDFWSGGINLLKDCGSYKYFAADEPEMESYFKSIWAHNTILVDNESPLRLASRFMWLPWPKANKISFEIRPDSISFKGSSFAYDRNPWNVIHTRNIITDHNGSSWTIKDRLSGSGKHDIELRWNLPSEARIIGQDAERVQVGLIDNWFLEINSVNLVKIKMFQAQAEGGWESLYYDQKKPISTLSVKKSCQLPNSFTTRIYRKIL